MTITSTTSRNDYTGNGAVDTYAYGFKIFANTDLLVTVRNLSDVETTLVLTTDYTVTGVGDNTGGNVVLVNSSQAWLDTDGDLLTNFSLTLRRVNPLKQETDIRNQGSFLPETHEDQMDREVMIAQQQQDEIDRSIKVSETESALGLTLPVVAVRKNKFLAFDASGDPIASSGDAGSVTVSTYMETVLDDTTAAAARATLGFGTITEQEFGYLASAKFFLRQRGCYNVGLATAQTSVAGDSIKITSADGTAFSSSNVGFIVFDSVTAGQISVLQITADVTINLTGAHWGAGGKGDLTDQKLVVYALNNNGSLAWGVGTLSQVRLALGTLDSTTATDINLPHEILVNTALTADAQAIMCGYFKANFDDTGGSSEDLWTVQTADEDIVLGFTDIPIQCYFTSNDGSPTLASAAEIVRNYEDKGYDTHNAVIIGATDWRFLAPYPGRYRVTAGHAFAGVAVATANTDLTMRFRVAAADKVFLRTILQEVDSYRLEIAGSGPVEATLAQAIDVQLFQNCGNTATYDAGGASNFVLIEYIGPSL